MRADWFFERERGGEPVAFLISCLLFVSEVFVMVVKKYYLKYVKCQNSNLGSVPTFVPLPLMTKK